MMNCTEQQQRNYDITVSSLILSIGIFFSIFLTWCMIIELKDSQDKTKSLLHTINGKLDNVVVIPAAHFPTAHFTDISDP